MFLAIRTILAFLRFLILKCPSVFTSIVVFQWMERKLLLLLPLDHRNFLAKLEILSRMELGIAQKKEHNWGWIEENY